jgi:hypothetical protein
MSERSTRGQRLAAGRQHLARLGQPVEDTPGSRRLEGGIVHRRLQALRLRHGRRHRRIRFRHPALRLRQAGHRALHAGLIRVQLAAADEPLVDQALGALQRLAGQRHIGLRLAHPGPRFIDGLPRLRHLRLLLPQLGAQVVGIQPRHHRPRLDHVALVRPQLRQPPGNLGRHIHLGRLQPPVPGRQPRRQAGRTLLIEEIPACCGQHQKKAKNQNLPQTPAVHTSPDWLLTDWSLLRRNYRPAIRGGLRWIKFMGVDPVLL